MEPRPLNPPDSARLMPGWRRLLRTETRPSAAFPIGARSASSTKSPMRQPCEAKAYNCAGRRALSWVESQSSRATADSTGISRQTQVSDRLRDRFRIEGNLPISEKETARESGRIGIFPPARTQDEMRRECRPPMGARNKRSQSGSTIWNPPAETAPARNLVETRGSHQTPAGKHRRSGGEARS